MMIDLKVCKLIVFVFRYRPSKEKFPIIVSQDCGHQETSDAIDKYASQIHAHIKVGQGIHRLLLCVCYAFVPE